MTQGNSRISKRSFSDVQYDGVQGALTQTSGSLQGRYVDGAVGQKGIQHNTQKLSMPIGQMKRCWRDCKDGGVGWNYCFILFLINLGSFGGNEAGVKGI